MISGNAQSEIQEYEFTLNERGPVETFTLRKDGRFHLTKIKMNYSYSLHIGKRDAYFDPSF